MAAPPLQGLGVDKGSHLQADGGKSAVCIFV